MMAAEEVVRRTDTPGCGGQARFDAYVLANSVVVPEDGPAGLILRVERVDGQTEYAGPMCDPQAALAALSEVANHG